MPADMTASAFAAMHGLEMDRKITRKRVEEALETVRIYRQIGFKRREMRTTSSYEPRFHGATNTVTKAAENIAVWNVDMEEELRKTSEQVEEAVTRLWKKEREIIEKRYLSEETTPDFLLCHDLNLSERTYRRVKGDAICKLGIMLEVAVYVRK
ncbi:ArpU family phage packaging/lysis transcriptional regulator [Gorillibacterium massiliense]|uniref:ArpU family phage packaging/lysis transcriptional regulator n=1 Tax=Gorillibacterium massiliense TaxID=1280390 RepID=UPI0004AEDAE0|nr:ArpU family phage packaging/lysis transcriptional regulator [Gorillibacterium massiliense]